MKNINEIKEWKYSTSLKREDAYEKIIPILQKLSENYSSKSEEEKDIILNKMIEEIRKINIFPIIYYNEDGIKEEIKSIYEKDNVCFVENGVYTQLQNGWLLLDFLFPNIHLATTCNEKTCMYDRFYKDDKLKKCLDKYLMSDRVIYNMRTVFFAIGRFYWDTPINFSPMKAKIIFEHYCPENGTIYDYSSGYGGRMLGALCSKHNFTYMAVEPNTNTFHNLKKMGKYIDNTLGKRNYKIFNLCSEKFQPKKESIDFIFSCPPFYKKENYCNEITQSINNYPEYNDWLEEYVRPTVRNCYIALKEQGVYGVDILDYSYSGKTIPLVEDWIRIAREEGFVLKDTITIGSKFRKKEEDEGERAYMFMKNEAYELPDYTNSSEKEKAKLKQQEYARAKYRKEHRTVGEYDIYGNLLELYDYYDFDNKEILKSKTFTKDFKYYRIYYGEDIILQELDVKQPICFVDNQYFFSFAELGDYVGCSRQAVQQSYKRNSKKIKGHDIKWLEQ